MTLSILIPSCDAYADIWPTFFTLFRKHWSDCPYPVYLGSNTVSCKEPDVHTILVGEDHSWAESTRHMVENISSPYVLMILEDFLLLSPVNSGRIGQLLRELSELQGGYLRLKPFPKPDRRLAQFKEIGEIEPGAPYRSALQAAIWDRETLLELLRDGDSAWDMEVLGSRRSDRMNRGFYCVWKSAIDYFAGVTMGKWTPKGLALCRAQGAAVDLSRRPGMTAREAIKLRLGWSYNSVFNRIPWKVRERMLDSFRSLRKSLPLP